MAALLHPVEVLVGFELSTAHDSPAECDEAGEKRILGAGGSGNVNVTMYNSESVAFDHVVVPTDPVANAQAHVIPVRSTSSKALAADATVVERSGEALAPAAGATSGASPGKTPWLREQLRSAIRTGDLPQARLFAEEPDAADAAAADSQGRTALHHAVLVRNIEGVALATAKWPSLVHALDRVGWSPFHYACFLGDVKIVEHLIRTTTPNLHAVTREDKSSCMHLATQAGNADLLKILEENGAAVNAVDASGWTALHEAAKAGNCEVARCLVHDCRANVTLLTTGGCTALELARSSGNAELAAMLASCASATPVTGCATDAGGVVSGAGGDANAAAGSGCNVGAARSDAGAVGVHADAADMVAVGTSACGVQGAAANVCAMRLSEGATDVAASARREGVHPQSFFARLLVNWLCCR